MIIQELYTCENAQYSELNLFDMAVSAGLPIDIGNELSNAVDINELLIEHPVTSFFAKVKGDDMSQIGIREDDIIIFDTSLEPVDGKIIIINVKNEMAVKVYRNINDVEYIQSSNNQFLPLNIHPYLEFNIIGVVTKVIHPV